MRPTRRLTLVPAFLFMVACAYGQDPPTRPIPVYISDFELSATTSRRPSPPQQTPPAPAQKPQQGATGSSASDGTPLVYQDADAPPVQARRLMDFFSTTLLQTLQKNGYAAAPQWGARPSNGVLIRGIFAEYDDMNRVRRAILGSASMNAKFALYVGIFNLALPDQPLYELAAVQFPDNRYGPVITLNNYIPLAKDELDKNPTQEAVREVCSRIVRDLTNLLDANRDALASLGKSQRRSRDSLIKEAYEGADKGQAAIDGLASSTTVSRKHKPRQSLMLCSPSGGSWNGPSF